MRRETEPREPASECHEHFVETESERLDRLGIYGEVKRELIKRGIPTEEIAFIHDFDTPAKKAQAFAAANAGRIRVMLASTEKAGTGVNMQERLYALHHLDAPWRPSDVEQREGRILRQGNRFAEVRIFNYVTENSFDGYMWQTLENKARFISQIMAGEVTARTVEDIDDLVMTAAQVKAIASGNPRILERVSVEVELSRLSRLYTVWRNSRRNLKWEMEALPPRLQEADQRVTAYEQALAVRDAQPAADTNFVIQLRTALQDEKLLTVTERAQAYDVLEQLRRAVKESASAEWQCLSMYRGFELLAQRQRQREEVLFAPVEGVFRVPESSALFPFRFGDSAQSALQSIEAQLRGLDAQLSRAQKAQSELRHKEQQLMAELAKGWEYAPKYAELQAQLARVNQALQEDGSETGAAVQFVSLDEEALRACEPLSKQAAVAPTTIVAAHTVIAQGEMATRATQPADELQVTTAAEEPLALPATTALIEPVSNIVPPSLEELRATLLKERRVPIKRKAVATANASTAQMSLW